MMKAMRKVDCQTTQEEAIRILQNLKYLSVAMLNEDGSPYNVVVDCVYDDGKIYFHSANEGQKLDCIRHDPRVCAVGYSGATSDAANSTTRYASVVIHGKAHILEDKERKLDICRYYYTPLVTGEIAEDITLHLTYAGIITFWGFCYFNQPSLSKSCTLPTQVSQSETPKGFRFSSAIPPLP